MIHFLSTTVLVGNNGIHTQKQILLLMYKMTLCESGGLCSATLLLLGWFLHVNCKATPTIDTNSICHVKAIELV